MDDLCPGCGARCAADFCSPECRDRWDAPVTAEERAWAERVSRCECGAFGSVPTRERPIDRLGRRSTLWASALDQSLTETWETVEAVERQVRS